MTTARDTWLALDIGGANMKGAHSSGVVLSRPFELWRRPAALPAELISLVASMPAFDRLALTMTAELCDCFPTKREGVLAVLDAVIAAAAGRPVAVWGVDGRFHGVNETRKSPLNAAASNWLALATVAARLAENAPALLIDVGSTTTDLIPLSHGIVMARGRTDTERLQCGELVYAGVRRTPLCALAQQLSFRGSATRVAAEWFATSLDVFLTLGDIAEAPDEQATADSRPATIDAARDRLARIVGADREGFSARDAIAISTTVRESLVARLVEAAEESCRVLERRPAVVVISGAGEFLARAVARRVVEPGGTIESLADRWGPTASVAACARALLELAEHSAAFP